jgi:phosphoserine phosphatase
MKKVYFPLIIVFVGILSGCGVHKTENVVKKDYFTTWNDCKALAALKDYVEDVTNPQSANFIKEEDRIATFDMDGTFVGELYPTYFEYNMFEYRALDDASYKDKAPADVKETAQEIRDFVRSGKPLPDHFNLKHGQAAAKAYAGMTVAEFDAYVKAYADKPANGFKGMTFGQGTYKPMLEVINYLKDHGFTYYVVSGSDRLIVRALATAVGFDPNHVIGTDIGLRSSKQGDVDPLDYTMSKDEKIIRTDEFILKDEKNNKVLQISQEIGKVPVLSFGNSSGDAAMHNYCLTSPHRCLAFMLVANDNIRDHANLEEAAKREAKWREAGYMIISMRDDFKTIYGEGVEKTDFIFK